MRKAVWTAVEPMTARLGCLGLIMAGLSMGLAGLISIPVCALVVTYMVVVAVALPTLDGPDWADARVRPWIGFVGLVAVVALGRFFPAPTSTTRSSFASTHLSDAKLAGLMAAFAAGALVVIACECGERRGLYSALVLSVSATTLTTLSSPGKQMIPALVIGWPASLLSMTLMAVHMHRLAQIADVTSTTVDRLTARLVPRRDTIILGVAILLASVMIIAVHTVPPKGFPTDPIGWGAGRALAAKDAAPRTPSSYSGETLNLRMTGELDRQPFADIPSDSPDLWRMGTFNSYDSVSGWTTTDSGFAQPSLINSGFGAVEVVRSPNDVSEPIANTTRRYRVKVRSASFSEVLTPGPAYTVTAPWLAGNTIVAPEAGDRLHLLGGEVPSGSSYDITSTRLLSADRRDDESTLRGTPISDPARPDEIRDLYLPLPASVPARVTRLGQRLVRNSPDLLAAVNAVQAEVRSRIAYREGAPIAEAGIDPVDDALFRTHRGFSEQLASAEVVLLRAGGIPARVVVGLADGDRDGAVRTLQDSDVRAWVEVWFPGWGWVTSDPASGGLAKVWVGKWILEHAAAAAHAVYSATLGYPIRFASDFIILLAVIMYAIVTRRTALRRRRAAVGANGRPIDPALITALIQLERALRGRGRRIKQQTPQTLEARLDELADSHPALAGQLARPGTTGLDRVSALMVLELAIDGREPPPDDEIQAAASTIEQVARDVNQYAHGILTRRHLPRG